MNTSKHDKSIKELFRGKCWSYLHDNFHKFTDDNKIKVALALVCKDLDKDISNGNETKIIIVRDSGKVAEPPKEEANVIGRELSFNGKAK